MKFTNIISQIRKAALVVALIFICALSTASAADITLSGSENYTAQDGDVLTGSTSGTVTIASDASITLSDVTITGGIVCEGTATITLDGTNIVNVNNAALAHEKAGIQIGSSGTTLTIKGDGSLTATGGSEAAGIGLGRTWDASVTAGSIVIEGGTVTANGAIGIGIGKVGNDQTAAIDGISIKGGTVNASLGKGYIYYGCTATVGYIKIYDTIDMVDASKITETVTYMHVDGESATDVTANKTDYFTIGQDGDRRIITPKDDTDYDITIADGIEHGTITGATTAKYMETVTINATPDFGYRLVRLVVKDADDNDVASTGNTFLMPKSSVTVSAVFEQSTHGTTEFVWSPSQPSSYVTGTTIYDGLTTVNIQKTGQNFYVGTSYTILKYEGSTNYRFRLDNNENEQAIPFTGTGEFVQNYNPTVFYVTDNNELGYYDITLTDVGNGKWSVSILKTVPVVADIPDQTYTGSAITPEPLVVAGSLDLTKGTDYEYFYENNTNSGTATVTVTFEGDYESLGSVEKTFNITPKVTSLGALTLTEDQNGKTAVIDGNYPDADAFSFDSDIENVSVTFNRTFTSSATSTIILPFYIAEGKYSGGDFYTLKSVENNIADMTKVTSVTAHTPYLFVPNGETFSITGNVTIKATTATEYSTESEDGKWVFKGIYQRKRWGADDGDNKDYCFAANAIDDISVGEFVKIGTYVQVKPFRCYLTRNGSISKSAEQLPETIKIRLIDETASVITPDDPQGNTGDITTPVSEIANNNGVKVWSYDGIIYIESAPSTAYTIVDMTGRTLKNGVTNSTRETVTLSRTAGIVIVIINGKTFKVNY